jgi:hypothetical protein
MRFSLGARYVWRGDKRQTVICPRCGKKEFSLLYDNKLERFSAYGKCNWIHKCQFQHLPPPAPNPTLGGERPLPLKQWDYNVKAENRELSLTDKKEFTLISPIGKEVKALKQVCLQELVKMANALPYNLPKTRQLNVLKELYPVGGPTSGAHCVSPAPYLFFDIDKAENPWLLTPARASESVFEKVFGFGWG